MKTNCHMFMFSIFAAKLVIKFLRIFGRGATTLPGRIALKLNSGILSRLSNGVHIVVITGTNGKTTSARIIEEGIKTAGKTYFINRSGANLITGITTAFIENSTLSGRCKVDYAVIECDENAFVKVSQYIKADVVLVTNVFRDQLDRYGEVSHTLDSIRRSVDNLPDAKLVINADCSLTKTLERPGCITYGMSVAICHDTSSTDGMSCLKCGSRLEYSYHTYDHLGDYVCPSCGFKRGNPDFQITDIVHQDALSSTVIVNSSLSLKVNLGGIYNVYNAIGAYAALYALGIDKESSQYAIEHFSGAFGRMENWGNIHMILVKNPAGLNLACNYIDSFDGDKTIVFSLNDNAADGRDVSWIWDSDIHAKGTVYTSGKRSADMALRLKYSGIESTEVHDVADLAEKASKKGAVFIVPTYTSMMAMRPRFVEKFGGKEFWQ